MKEPRFWDNGLLQRTRQQIGVSQSALSQKSGVTRAVISDLESGRTRISSDDALRLWGALSSLAPDNELARSMAIAAAAAEENSCDGDVHKEWHELQSLLRRLEAFVAFRLQAGQVKRALKESGLGVAFWKFYRDNYTVTADPKDLLEQIRAYIYNNIKKFDWEKGGGEGATYYKPTIAFFGKDEDAELRKDFAKHKKAGVPVIDHTRGAK